MTKTSQLNSGNDDTIAVVLSTYNGAAYITELIDSLKRQTFTHWHCYIRDDGSKDNSIEVVKSNIAGSDKFTLIEDTKGNLKINGSHLTLFASVKENYIAVCDQDDVWLENKLEASLKKLKEIETEDRLPALVHTDSYFVDEKLNILRPLFIGNRGKKTGLPGILFANSVQGGSVLFNRALCDVMLSTPVTLIYDYQLAMLAELTGRRAFLSQPLLKYRQHAQSSIAKSDTDKKQDNHISTSLLTSLSGYNYFRKIDYDKLSVSPDIRKQMDDYFYLFEGKNILKKCFFLAKNNYAFYRKKDYLSFLKLVLLNADLTQLAKQD
ncbi:MAG TPA: glycosyltransferase [Methylophilus sp.]|nr:glycosyltransferase [Methylophilus sp.]HQQ33318.1 glycosyltransferase [Methylophilus sp.]